MGENLIALNYMSRKPLQNASKVLTWNSVDYKLQQIPRGKYEKKV